MQELRKIGEAAKGAEPCMRTLDTNIKNKALLAIANALESQKEYLLKENEKDITAAVKNNMKEGLVDRLRLTKDRIAGMAEGLRQITALLRVPLLVFRQ